MPLLTVFALLVLTVITPSTSGAGLTNVPVLGDGGANFILDGGPWLASKGTLEVPSVVPGDLITDLHAAGRIRDPLFGTAWRDDAAVWASSPWTFTRRFNVSSVDAVAAAASVFLVFESVKMAADVSLNGVRLGSCTNEHLRYVFDATAALNRSCGGSSVPCTNILTVNFPLPSVDTRNDEGRYMACSGGWDWSQYSNTATPGGLPTLSFGIPRSVYLVPVNGAALSAITPLVRYDGKYPTAPLTDATASGWTVNVTAYLKGGRAGARGLVTAVGDWTGATPVSAPIVVPPSGLAALSLALSVAPGAVRLWWPNGVAAPVGSLQPLYRVNLTFSPNGAAQPAIADSRRIGFRTFALVTDDDSDPSRLANLTGSGNLTVRYVVNGAGIWARGANLVPVDEYAGRADVGAYTALVSSAAAAGMNTVLVWGGGIFQYDEWYDACDERGLLLYHDLMYSSEGHSAHLVSSTLSQEAEVTFQVRNCARNMRVLVCAQASGSASGLPCRIIIAPLRPPLQVRRLSAHPCIAVWSACNECGGGALYSSFSLATLAASDASRAVWPASPSSGWASGVDRLWSRPNGDALGVRLAPPPANPASLVQDDVYYMGYLNATVQAATADDCSQACGATPGCTVAVYGGESCQMKGFGFPVAAWGVPWTGSVWPPSTPVPLPLPPAPCLIETHGPYNGGNGWPAINSGDGTTPNYYTPDIPPTLPAPPPPYGPRAPGVFVSEFGVTSFSSFESMSPTLDPADWGAHAPPLYWRSYSQDSIVGSHFGSGAAAFVNYSVVGDAAVFARQLLLSQLAAALEVKARVEQARAGNAFGTMVWQLNEIFPTGGWGSLEYGSARGPTPGQVLGGRWKPLHSWYATALFRDLIVACGAAGACYARNDGPLAGFEGRAVLSLVHLATGAAAPLSATPVSLPAGPAAVAWFCAGGGGSPRWDRAGAACPPWATLLAAHGCDPGGGDCVLNATLVDAASGAAAAANPSLLAPAKATKPFLSPDPAVAAELSAPPAHAGDPIGVTVRCSAPALFVTLTTAAQGYFSENAFLVTPAEPRRLVFVPQPGADQMPLLNATLRVMHL